MSRSARRRGQWGLAIGLAIAALAFAFVQAAALQAATATPAATESKAKSVDINHFAFHPGTLAVGVGAQVTFTNSSGVTHTATRAGAFDTGRIKPGHSATVRFTRKGTFPYHCKIHNFMHGKIVVQ